MAEDVYLILHGWGGNKPAHWQEHLVGKLEAAGKTYYYPKMPEPTAPNLEAWQETLQGVLDTITEAHPGASVTVMAHSLGCINWIHFAARRGADAPKLADRVLLVAPPYVMTEAPPLDAPPGVTGFFPPPFQPETLKAIANETTLLASNTDDYATYDQSVGVAAKLDVPVQLLDKGGHISPYYGYGEWPWVLAWALKEADFPPQPNS
jgi:predicted alpha/beta hydrolase family esterase